MCMHKVRNINKTKRLFPYGLAVRIPGFHPGGPGSTPGMGTPNYFLLYSFIGHVQSNLFNADIKGTEPIVRFTEVSVL